MSRRRRREPLEVKVTWGGFEPDPVDNLLYRTLSILVVGSLVLLLIYGLGRLLGIWALPVLIAVGLCWWVTPRDKD